MNRFYRYSVLVTLVSFSSLFSQWDLSSLNTRAVQGWRSGIVTQINSVTMDITINRGIATTLATLEFTPKASTWFADNLETTTSFQLPVNTVITDMYLMIFGEKVKAFLQDKALASAQYESIVQRRRDPAFLSYRGMGGYDLKIYPTLIDTTRRIEITFNQSLETDTVGCGTYLPIKWSNIIVNSLLIRAKSMDNETYSLNINGKQYDIQPSTPLGYFNKDIAGLASTRLVRKTSVPQSNYQPWYGVDDQNAFFGFNYVLKESAIKFPPEPEIRNIILDLSSSNEYDFYRARNLALLTLLNYAEAPYKANVGFVEDSGIRYLFPAPVLIDGINLEHISSALRAWSPQNTSRAWWQSLQTFMSTPPATPSVNIFISDGTSLFYPQADSLAQVYKNHNAVVFAYYKSSYLSGFCILTGGKGLGQLNSSSWYFPTLWNSDYTYSKIGDIQISHNTAASGIKAGNLALVQGSNYNTKYYSNTNNSIPLRISGKFYNNGPLSLKLSGKFFGRPFEHLLQINLNGLNNGTEAGGALWAFQKSEQWYGEKPVNYQDSITAQGKKYHIVNTQLSLLALEPGVALWQNPDVPVEPGTAIIGQSTPGTASSSTTLPGSTIPDGFESGGPGCSASDPACSATLASDYSFEEIVSLWAKRFPSVRVSGASQLSFEIFGAEPGTFVYLEIRDIKGTLIHMLRAVAENGFHSAQWAPSHKAHGLYFLKFLIKGKVYTHKFIIK